MTRTTRSGLPGSLNRQRFIVYALLFVAGLYALFVFLPGMARTQIIGFSGDLDGGRFVVSAVMDDSPAAHAGLQAGDVIVAQGSWSTADWARLYAADVEAYLARRQTLPGHDVSHEIDRNQARLRLNLTPRALTAGEIGFHYGVRLSLVVFLIGLTLFIVASKPREHSAFLMCLGFCFAIPWLASVETYWPALYAPMIRGVSLPVIYLSDLLEMLSLQLVMGALVHIALVFPERQPVLRRHPWLPTAAYSLSLLVPAVVMLFASGGVLNRLTSVYVVRLWLDTGLLILATGVTFVGYRQCRSPARREASRWIIASLTVVAVVHIGLWNIPAAVFDQPLVPNYNWVLLPITLIPIAMTLSIANHELFGIRGIIRGRIMLLEARLRRERAMVIGRDQRIREMTQEIHKLKSELGEYAAAEQPRGYQGRSAVLAKLEDRYPDLARLRQESLISVSRTWDRVFETAAVAARGTAPAMIVGESGTGKTHVARAVHLLSDRNDRDYKEISCAQFEHTDPAFALGRLFGVGTGHGLPNVPKEGQKGLLEECDGGTLFLDDFDRLPLNVQDLLLFPLEGKPFEPGIGRGPARRVSVKFIFATNQDPLRLAGKSKFQADVLARIGTRIDVPPLRDRPEDIPLLVEHFTTELCAELGHEISVVSPKALNLLCQSAYSLGNARELKAEIRQAIGKAMLEDDNVLRAGYLSEALRDTTVREQEQNPLAPPIEAAPLGGTERDESRELAVLRKHAFQIKPAEAELGLSHKSRTLSNHLRGMCIKALAENDWELRHAAVALCESQDAHAVARIEAKMRRYLRSIESHVDSGSEAKLFNNLPAVYHDFLDQTIHRVRAPRENPQDRTA